MYGKKKATPSFGVARFGISRMIRWSVSAMYTYSSLIRAFHSSGTLEELVHRPRPVDHLEAARLVVAELRHRHGRHRVHQPVGLAVGRREQPREAGHLAARPHVALRLAEVVVEDLRLPLLVQRRLRRQDRVVRPPPRRARLAGRTPRATAGRSARRPRRRGRAASSARAVEQLLRAQRRRRVRPRDVGARRHRRRLAAARRVRRPRRVAQPVRLLRRLGLVGAERRGRGDGGGGGGVRGGRTAAARSAGAGWSASISCSGRGFFGSRCGGSGWCASGCCAGGSGCCAGGSGSAAAARRRIMLPPTKPPRRRAPCSGAAAFAGHPRCTRCGGRARRGRTGRGGRSSGDASSRNYCRCFCCAREALCGRRVLLERKFWWPTRRRVGGAEWSDFAARDPR